jgi:molybdopterin converting factor small subunit
MEFTVIYSGILAEKAGKSEEPLTGAKSLFEIKDILAAKYQEFQKLNYVMSLNGVVEHQDIGIKEGDQITLIPPLPGG